MRKKSKNEHKFNSNNQNFFKSHYTRNNILDFSNKDIAYDFNGNEIGWMASKEDRLIFDSKTKMMFVIRGIEE